MREEKSFDQTGKNSEDPSLMNRRQFLKLGGGIIILFSCGDLEAQQRRRRDLAGFLRGQQGARVLVWPAPSMWVPVLLPWPKWRLIERAEGSG
jgi:hypothetical protein